MISITFGLGGTVGEGGFFPESDFSVILEDEAILASVEADSITLEVIEENITMEIE